jgi:hypothetical protein
MRITESKLRRIIREELDETHDQVISRMLNMDLWTFDQTQEGWRSLPKDLQIDALRAYIEGPLRLPARPSKSGKHGDKDTTIWHLGQALAIRGGPGDRAQAVRWMKLCKNPDDDQWNNYVDATIAFLEDNRAAFEEHASGENYNSSTLERLRDGWGDSYSQAY